jgi:hypothetical protein
MKSYSSLLVVIVVLCSGCASLTKSQLNAVNDFGQFTCNFSSYPGSIISIYNNAHVQNEMFRANSITNPEQHFEAISLANDFKKKSQLISQETDLSLHIIDQYAQSLVALTSAKPVNQLDTASHNFGNNLDSLISKYNTLKPQSPLPTGIGNDLSALLMVGGDLYIRSKQAEAVRRVVPQGDVIIAKMCANLLAFLEPADTLKGLHYMIAQEKRTLANNYKAYLGLNRDEISIGKDKEAYSGYLRHQRFVSLNDDELCLNLLQNLDNAELLRRQCVSAVKDLRQAHAQLLAALNEKRTLNNISGIIKNYVADVKSMNLTLTAIK